MVQPRQDPQTCREIEVPEHAELFASCNYATRGIPYYSCPHCSVSLYLDHGKVVSCHSCHALMKRCANILAVWGSGVDPKVLRNLRDEITELKATICKLRNPTTIAYIIEYRHVLRENDACAPWHRFTEVFYCQREAGKRALEFCGDMYFRVETRVIPLSQADFEAWCPPVIWIILRRGTPRASMVSGLARGGQPPSPEACAWTRTCAGRGAVNGFGSTPEDRALRDPG